MAEIYRERINSNEIIPEIRKMAVAWNGHYSNDAIWDTMKLASDIQHVSADLLKEFAAKWGINHIQVDHFLTMKLRNDK